LLLLPLIALGLYLLLLLLPRIDPRRANYARFRGAYLVLRVAILMFLVLLYGFVLLWTRGIRLGVLVIPILAGGLLVVMGVVMGRVQPNWFVGIRRPSTLSSDLSWRKPTSSAGGSSLVVLSSGLLWWHHKQEASYTTSPEVLFGVCFGFFHFILVLSGAPAIYSGGDHASNFRE